MTEWINVNDELPENDKEVWVHVRGHFNNQNDPLNLRVQSYQFIGKFNRRDGWKVKFCPEKFLVEHWRLLPEYPKSEIFPNG